MIDGSEKRTGTEHEEIVTPGGNTICKICGQVARREDVGNDDPDPEFHPELYTLDELADAGVIERINCWVCGHNAGPDYHLDCEGGTVCDDCWDERLQG